MTKENTGAADSERAIFAAGCFWGVEAALQEVRGVLQTTAGYTGGSTADPDYKTVCSGTTGHAEAVEVVFDPAAVSYADLLEHFWQLHDPTQKDRQGPDIGSQYRSAIFYIGEAQRQAAEDAKHTVQKKHARTVVTEISPAGTFWRAEDDHQCYVRKNRSRFF